jgi:glycosyltransferase involved in cell wall biosynthesis
MKRLAIFLVGGVGVGIASQGIPAIAALTNALALRFRVTVYTLLPPDPGFRPTTYAIRTPPPCLSGAAGKLRWPYLAAQFFGEHRKEAYGALLSFWAYPMGPFVVALAKSTSSASVLTVLGGEAASVPSIRYGVLRRPVSRRLLLSTCDRASALIVLSTEQRDALRLHGLRREVDVIPFGADPRMFTAQPKALVPPLKILHVANLTEVKDQGTLLRGFALLRRDIAARLRLVGPDYMNGRLQRLARELDVEHDVEFVGPVVHTALPAHYSWADMFVLTSLSEGASVALAEAAMSGVLLVSTRVGSVPDLGEAGAVIVRTGDPVDLAEKIRAIASDRDSWARKVARAREWAEHRDLPWTVDRLTSVLERVGSWT